MPVANAASERVRLGAVGSLSHEIDAGLLRRGGRLKCLCRSCLGAPIAQLGEGGQGRQAVAC
jgi:hypothetical protein